MDNINIFLLPCMPDNFLLDVKHCKFYLVWCLRLLYSYKYWVFFWEAVKLFWNSLVSSFWAFLGRTRAAFSPGLIFPSIEARLLLLYPVPHEWWSFLLWLLGTGTFPGPVWSLDTVPSDPFGWFFSWPRGVFSHAFANHYSTEYFRGSSKDLCISLFLWLSPLSALWLENFLQEVSWGYSWTYLIYFPSLRDSFLTWCLILIFLSYILFLHAIKLRWYSY